MSGDAKKRPHKKNKNDPKEQRKPRNAQEPANVLTENKPEPLKVPEKPVIQEPGPEFYNSLKRETDEILKITEESNTKYRKKVIQSNWQKYEAPIESYEEREEVENLGADFEQLVNDPPSSGGHFQFKHEKSWDTVIQTTQYDKYFEIDMANLAIKLSSIPFYERNGLEAQLFSQGDILSMTHRASKFKQRCTTADNTDCDFVDPSANLVDALQKCLVLKKNYNEPAKEIKSSASSVSKEESNDANIYIEEKGLHTFSTLEQHSQHSDVGSEIDDILECKDAGTLDDKSVAINLSEITGLGLDESKHQSVRTKKETVSGFHTLPTLKQHSDVGSEIDDILECKDAGTLDDNVAIKLSDLPKLVFDESKYQPVRTEKETVSAESGNTANAESKEDLEEWLEELLS